MQSVYNIFTYSSSDANRESNWFLAVEHSDRDLSISTACLFGHKPVRHSVFCMISEIVGDTTSAFFSTNFSCKL